MYKLLLSCFTVIILLLSSSLFTVIILLLSSSLFTVIIVVIIRYKARGGSGTTAPEERLYNNAILKQKDGEAQKSPKPKGIKKTAVVEQP